ncbi:MAG: T9SS type A sorting domain-containing protein [Bacteroidota bacterium]
MNGSPVPVSLRRSFFPLVWPLLVALLSGLSSPVLAQETPGWHVISGPYARTANDLEVLPDGSLLAAAVDGLYRFTPEEGFWRKFAFAERSVQSVEYRNGTYYVLVSVVEEDSLIYRFYNSTDGETWTPYPDPPFSHRIRDGFAVTDDGTLVVTIGLEDDPDEPLVREFDPIAEMWVIPEGAPERGGAGYGFGVSVDNTVYVCGTRDAGHEIVSRGVARRAPDGTWTEIGEGLSIDNPRGCFVASDGSLYVGALFVGFQAVAARWREDEGWVRLDAGLSERPEASGILDTFAELPDGTIVVASQALHTLAPGAERWEQLPPILPYTGPDVVASVSLPSTDVLTVSQGDLWAATRADWFIPSGEVNSPSDLPLLPPLDGIFRLTGLETGATWVDESLRFGGTAYTGVGTDAGGITWTGLAGSSFTLAFPNSWNLDYSTLATQYDYALSDAPTARISNAPDGTLVVATAWSEDQPKRANGPLAEDTARVWLRPNVASTPRSLNAAAWVPLAGGAPGSESALPTGSVLAVATPGAGEAWAIVEDAGDIASAHHWDGEHWTAASLPTSAPARSLAGANTPAGDVRLVGLADGTVATSSDGGTTWTLAPVGTLPVEALSVDEGTLYAGADGVYQSSDGGQSWTPLGTGLAARQVTALAASRGHVMASLAPTDDAGDPVAVFWLPPGTDIWAETEAGLGSQTVHTLNVAPDGTLYAVSAAGLYRGLSTFPVAAEPVAPGVLGSLSVDAYPNPFVDAVRVQLDVPQSGDVRLALYDVLGRRVHIAARTLAAGTQTVELAGLGGLAAGRYFLRVEVGIARAVIALTLAKR